MYKRKDDQHIDKIVDSFKERRSAVSAVTVTVATFKALKIAFATTPEPNKIGSILAAVKAELPQAAERQIEVVLRHYHRSGVIVFRNGVITRGSAFTAEEERVGDIKR